ncbi:MAG: N-acetylmuramoyl-L-alanine amidase, partial [Chloroflexales bacterium]|nr:N-acetylmuramoyl-L-alanine amidase [Chloroflexales bacterium]
ELARLRSGTGARAAGVTELEVNYDVAQRVAALLRASGVIVDILPATVPPHYDADAFVSLHADGSPSTAARGYKLATPWRTSRASQHLADSISTEYRARTGLPTSDAITVDMRGYYAFNYNRHTHAITRTTPAVIVEMGYLTNPTDRAFLTRQADRVAAGVARGMLRYLGERNPLDGAALMPPEFRQQRAISVGGVAVYAAPRDNAPIRARVDQTRRMMPFQERDGWYEVFVRGDARRVVGWVRKDEVEPTNDPLPAPPPSTT